MNISEQFLMIVFIFRTVVVLLTAGISGISCMLTDIPAVQICLFISFLSCGVASNVVSSATVESYPTALRLIKYFYSICDSTFSTFEIQFSTKQLIFLSIHRAMAVSISLMFARLGGVSGSTVAALLLDNNCEMAFYLSGGIVTS